MPSGPTRSDLFGALVSGDPRTPRLVCYRADGARTELSGASLTNWTAKVAGLLRDELGAAPGDLVSVLLPAGWQTAPVLLGAWWCGLTVTEADDPRSVAAFVPPGSDAAADEVFVASGHPLGAPTPASQLLDHQRDFTSAVLPQTDRLGAMADPEGDIPAVLPGDGAAASVASVASVAEAARAMAADLRAASAASRPVLLSSRPWSLPAGFATTMLATLAADGTLVQCPASWDADRLAATAAAEHATATVEGDRPGPL